MPIFYSSGKAGSNIVLPYAPLFSATHHPTLLKILVVLSGTLSEKHSIIHGSCNGLICVVDFSPPKLSNEEYLIDYRFYLWNPATRLRSQKSPCLSIPSSVSDPEFGFGYDSLSDTYKVVAIFCYFNSMDESVVEMKVYNIGDNCWRDIIQIGLFFPVTLNALPMGYM
ncbi:F-box associated interaction domain [Sesbania bispinosa]|nr:F-box associated interaction domain [Sesbania bispinosa]